MINQISIILQNKTGAILTPLLLMCLFSTKSLAQTPSYIDTVGLIGWYSFTGNANDSSSHSNNGAVFGATLTTDRFGNANCAYSFNGTSNYIAVPSNSSLILSNSYSISCWFYPTLVSGPQRTIVSQSRTSATQTGVCLNLDNLLGYHIIADNTDAVGTHQIATSITPTLNTWYHSVLTYDGTTLKIYVNDTLLNSILYTIDLSTNDHVLSFGSQNFSGGTDYFSGSIDDIGVWNRVLTPCEINKLFLITNSNVINQPINDTVLTGGIATYSITDTGNVATYQWQQNTGSTFVNLSNTSPYSGVATKTLTINPVTVGMNNYKYRCIRTDTGAGLCADTSNAANLIVNASTGIPNLLKEQITISPNPAANVLTITSPMAIEKIDITNMIGQKIISQRPNMNSISLDIKNLTSGIYIIKINDNCINRFVKE